MSTRTKWMKAGLCTVALLPAAAVLYEMASRSTSSEATPKARASQLPRDVLDPRSSAVRPDGKRLKDIHLQRPLRVGDRAPRLLGKDYLGRTFRIPSGGGRPAIWALSCGCLKCSHVLSRINSLRISVGDHVTTAGFVANTSDFVWGHHASSFWTAELHLVRDASGIWLQKLRPSSVATDDLPIVWACDGKGRLRYVGNPLSDPYWLQKLRKEFGLRDLPKRVRG